MRTLAQLLVTFLLNAAWQIAVIVAFVALADWLLRGTVAQYRHALWVIALVASLFFPLLSCSALLKSLSISGQPDTEIAAEPLVTAGLFPSEFKPTENKELQTSAARATPKTARRSFWISPIAVNGKLAEALGAIYLFFIFFRAAKLCRAWRRTRVIMSSAHSGEFSARAQSVIAQCQKAIGVGRLRILSSVLIPVPITLGVVNPLVVLPAELARETDEDVLTSAIGHELVHVARHDYILNLIYEFIYVPLSFHPAAALVRRRIKQTRELCCDERVTQRLIRPENYARSLVRLIGSVPISRRLAANTTIGITEADILEVRIMSLLRRTNLTARRKILLLVAASALLMMPCLTAAKFALNFDIAAQEPPKPAARQSKQELEWRQDESGAELKRIARQLKEQIRETPETQRRELEEKLREIERVLTEHDRVVQQYERQATTSKETMRQAQETLAQLEFMLAQDEKKRPENEARMKELQDRLGQLVTQYPDVRLSPQQLDELRSAEREIELQQKELTQGEKQKEEKLKQKERELKERTKIEDREQQEREEKEAREKQEMEEREAESESRGEKVEMKRRTKDEDGRGREERARMQAELTRDATISMDRAIQIAVSQHPGKVLACNLGRDGDKVFYHVVIISGDGEKSTATYVWVSATDGQILKTEGQKEKKEQEW